jgi:hypothetical protein
LKIDADELVAATVPAVGPDTILKGGAEALTALSPKICHLELLF